MVFNTCGYAAMTPSTVKLLLSLCTRLSHMSLSLSGKIIMYELNLLKNSCIRMKLLVPTVRNRPKLVRICLVGDGALKQTEDNSSRNECINATAENLTF